MSLEQMMEHVCSESYHHSKHRFHIPALYFLQQFIVEARVQYKNSFGPFVPSQSRWMYLQRLSDGAPEPVSDEPNAPLAGFKVEEDFTIYDGVLCQPVVDERVIYLDIPTLNEHNLLFSQYTYDLLIDKTIQRFVKWQCLRLRGIYTNAVYEAAPGASRVFTADLVEVHTWRKYQYKKYVTAAVCLFKTGLLPSIVLSILKFLLY